jgi:hypothetical protein
MMRRLVLIAAAVAIATSTGAYAKPKARHDAASLHRRTMHAHARWEDREPDMIYRAVPYEPGGQTGYPGFGYGYGDNSTHLGE